MTTFDTHIDGIECQCKVTYYRPHTQHTQGHFNFELLDRCGNPAPTLHTILAPADHTRLEDEYEAYVTAMKHGKDY